MSPASPRDGRSRKRPGLEEQRRRLVAVAVQQFGQHGVRAVTIAQLCAAAPVSKPTFYRCFPDKTALVDHLYQTVIQDVVDTHLLTRTDEGLTDLQAALDAVIDTIFERGAAARMLYVEANDPSSPAHAIVRRINERNAQAITDGYTGAGTTPPPRLVLLATIHAIQWLLHDALTRGLDNAVRAEAKAAVWDLVSRVFR